jgi:hypothetical protein
MEPIHSENNRFLPLNRILAKAYPHKVAVTVPAVTAGKTIDIVLAKYRKNLKVSSVSI